MGESLFGSAKKKTKATPAVIDPTFNALNQLRLSLATQTAAGGLPASMQGYLDRVVIPSTINQAILMGHGRSGEALEGVANATLRPGVDFLTALLSGVPSGMSPSGATQTTTSKQPGIADYVGLLNPIAAGVDWMKDLWKSA